MAAGGRRTAALRFIADDIISFDARIPVKILLNCVCFAGSGWSVVVRRELVCWCVRGDVERTQSVFNLDFSNTPTTSQRQQCPTRCTKEARYFSSYPKIKAVNHNRRLSLDTAIADDQNHVTAHQK